MSWATRRSLRQLAFCDTAGAHWGLALFEGEDGTLARGSRQGAGEQLAFASAPARLREAGEGSWRIEAADELLEVSWTGAPVGREAGGSDVWQAPCRVGSGSHDGDGAGGAGSGGFHLRGVAVAHTGWDPGRVTSARDVSAWFDEGVGYSLLAARPSRARGHDRDVVLAALLPAFGEPPVRAVEDARLSSTTGTGGRVMRAGLELWLEEPEADTDGTEEGVFPHRLAGVAIGPAVVLATPSLERGVTPFTWLSRGREGFGVFGLGTPR